MQNRFELPMMISAKELQDMGFSRSLAYRILQGDIIPVITVGKRRFVRQSALLEWLAEQEQKSPVGRNTVKIKTDDPSPAADSQTEALTRDSEKYTEPDDDQLTFDGFPPELSDGEEVEEVMDHEGT